MKQLLKLKAMGLLMLLLSIGYVKAQSLTPAEPVRQGELANPSLDAAGYDANKIQFVAEHPEQYNQLNATQSKEGTQNLPWGAPENKTQWVAEHPQEYANMKNSEVDIRTRITRAQFNAYPADKQQSALTDPNIIIID